MKTGSLIAAFLAILLLSAYVVALACDRDSLTVEAPDMVSINSTGLTISAFVTCNGSPVSGRTITWSSDWLTFPSGNTAVTDSHGRASIIASAGPAPSPTPGGSDVNAVADNGNGGLVRGGDSFTIVRVNPPTPLNPKIVVGHYQTNSLYAVTLTYSVSPAISGVPVAFAFALGEGNGCNYPASLEDQSGITDMNGKATVRVRSGDLREIITVICSYQNSCAETDVAVQGITGVMCASDQ